MQDIAEVLLQVANTSSTIDKQNILQNAGVPNLQKVLKFIYNPYFKTGISDAKLNNATAYKGYPVAFDIDKVIKYIVDNPTGDIETCNVLKTWMLSQPTEETKWLARGIITQNLKIGVSVTTLNKVYGPNFIAKLGCMLGTPLDKVKESAQRWPYIVTEKLDGVRRILIKQNGTVTMYSRNGHEDNGLVDIIQEATYLPDNYVYDGELLAIGDFVDSIAQRQATNSIANRKGERRGLTFNVFDMIPVSQFLNNTCTENALTRKLRLAATLGDQSGELVYPTENDASEYPMYMAARSITTLNELKYIKPVPILCLALCLEDVTPIVDRIWEDGGEGVMLNAAGAPYETKRVKTLIKMKKTSTFILRIEGFAEGTNKYEGMLGALIAKYKDNYVQVGSGFTDQERFHIWQNMDDYIGRLFEVEAFGESTNMQGFVSLNCPIFKRFKDISPEALFV